MQVLTPFLFAWLLSGAKAVIRTPLEAFRPSGELHVKRPDKLPLLPHRKTSAPPKGGLKVLYQTGVSLDLFHLISTGECFTLNNVSVLIRIVLSPSELLQDKSFQHKLCHACQQAVTNNRD